MKVSVISTSLFSLLGMSIIIGRSLAAPQEDHVDNLPSFGPVNHYSGYLDATDGCDTKTNGEFCKLHYWFVPSSTIPDDGPVVLWSNGGPGSTSIIGFLQELGPILINATGGLMTNPWSWTNVAHLLVLESPVGVGYSFCANQLKGQVCENTDKFTASATRAALVDFFDNKFPEFKPNDFFITGESYAGVYVPTLAKELLDNAPQVNLKGLAVGDPCTDNTAQSDSMNPLWYSHKYGLIDDAVYDTLWNKCDVTIVSLLMKGKIRPSTKIHADDADEKSSILNVTQDMTPECKLAFRKFMMGSSQGLSQSWKNLYIDDYSLFAPTTSAEDKAMTIYMNRDDVKKALHVEETPITSWPSPDCGFDYTSEYDACNDEAADGAPSMIDFYRELSPKLDNVWVYNGDTDPCVSYEGTRTAIKRVGFPELDGGGYRPWFYNHTATSLSVLGEKAALFGPDLLAVSTGAQFGGEVVNYEHNLSFVTFHGAGHMVPQFRPQAALHFLSKLVNGKSLSPLLPSNKTLVDADDGQFDKLMNDWTEKAKKSPYVDDELERSIEVAAEASYK